jgi:TPR repeat protein
MTRRIPAVCVVFVLLVGAAGCSSPFKSTPQLTASSTSADVAAVRANANAGDARAQFNLGYAYYLGRGVPQDDAQAVTWYRQAAEQGDAVAQSTLGYAYRDGQGVLQDDVEAHKWFNLAASRASAENRKAYAKARDALVTRMTPQQFAESQKLARAWVAAFGAR